MAAAAAAVSAVEFETSFVVFTAAWMFAVGESEMNINNFRSIANLSPVDEGFGSCAGRWHRQEGGLGRAQQLQVDGPSPEKCSSTSTTKALKATPLGRERNSNR